MNNLTFTEVFSNKMLSSGFLNTFQCLVMGMTLVSTNKVNFIVLSIGIALATRWFLMFIRPQCAKYQEGLNCSLFCAESGVKQYNDTSSQLITWSGFWFICCQKELFSSWAYCIFCVVFLVCFATMMFLQYNNNNSLDKKLLLYLFWFSHVVIIWSTMLGWYLLHT